MDRSAALDRAEEIVETIATEPMPVPVREVWVYGDVALGLDPVDRLDVYLTKDILLGDAADREQAFVDSHGVQGVGKSVRAEWAERYPEYLRANDSGHAAPEKCLAAHLLDDDEPIHLEVCNASFEDNVMQRLKGAMAREAYEQILDPRGVCLWVGEGDKGGPAGDGDRPTGDAGEDAEFRGTVAEESLAKLRDGDLPFPTLSGSLEMLGLDEEEAETAASAMREYRAAQTGATVRGDVV